MANYDKTKIWEMKKYALSQKYAWYRPVITDT